MQVKASDFMKTMAIPYNEMIKNNNYLIKVNQVNDDGCFFGYIVGRINNNFLVTVEYCN